jgi:micrococcal nuclease
MGSFVNFVVTRKLLAAGVSAGLIVGGAAAVSSAAGPTTATVTRVVDGDTIDVFYGGTEHRIRLLNVDTPETVDPNQPVQCLGPEATDFLEDRLPAGSVVTLQHDRTKYDPYDRELAGVYLDDQLVNAEIARAGLGVAVVYGDNDRFYGDVLTAQQEAEAAQKGLHSPDVECTLPAQVAAFTEEATQAEQGLDSTSIEALDSHAAALAAAAAVGASLQEALDGDRTVFPLLALTDGRLASLRGDVRNGLTRIDAERQLTKDARAAEVQRLEDEREAAEEAARLRAAQEAERKAAQEAERKAAQAAERRAAQRRTSSGSGSTGGSTSSGAGRYDGYTGCRAYGSGGTSIDEKGRRYTKINCTTKRPIG